MTIEELRAYCLSKNGVTESMPFDDKVLVFKVANKMFALASIVDFSYVNLKCNPEIAIELRADYEEITPGYQMSKKHWSSVSVKGNLSTKMIIKLIYDSYNLVVASLTKKLQNELRAQKGEQHT